jgi:phosphopantothenoylcysteine decarboxylase / phosphopantothenate---cysteine ligase
MNLLHRHFVIGVTGGIAAYKTCELVRRLQDEGATVQVVMTEGGTQFVAPLTFQALSGRPVYTNAWESPAQSGPDNGMPHIDLSREADAILVAPASADFIARLVGGQTNDLLSTLCLARDIPLLVAPAMNRQMWQSPATQRNIAQLQTDGVAILGPAAGAQACGETGDGRMLEAAELLTALVERFGAASSYSPAAQAPNIRGVLQDKHVLITAGPTFEPIDPVRGITNRSSGKMGFALARAAVMAGARVTLVAGPVSLRTPEKVMRHDVTTALEMSDAVMAILHQEKIDCFIGVAAVADWRPKSMGTGKIKKEAGGSLRDIEWVENPDILATVARQPNPPYCVGFAAETGEFENLAALLPAKRLRKQVPLLVGNIGNATFGEDHNRIMLCDERGITSLPNASKEALAQHLVFEVSKRVVA